MTRIHSFIRAVIRAGTAVLVVAGLAAGASAQDWRGATRAVGRVVDQDKQPIDHATVKLFRPESHGGTQTKTDKKGEWAIGGIKEGRWDVDVQAPGYVPATLSATLSSDPGANARTPMIIVLKKAAVTVDPNVEIRDGLVKAAALLNEKRYSEARAIYEGLYGKYPQAHQLLPLIARAYYAEGQYDKAIENLRAAIQKDPDDVDVKLLLGNVLIEKGDAEEGKQLLASIDDSRVTSPVTFVNVGVVLLNQNRPGEAIAYFTKAIDRFPEAGDAYYYRGLGELQMGKNPAARADLEKFVQIAPDASEAANARKILEQLK